MRLDHLLSKEHHEKVSALGGSRAVKEPGACSGHRLGATTTFPFPFGGVGARLLGALLGPETTPGPRLVGVVLLPRFGGGVWCLSVG